MDYDDNEFLYYGCNSYKDITEDSKTCDIVLIDSADCSETYETEGDDAVTEDFGSVRSEAVYIANRIIEELPSADFPSDDVTPDEDVTENTLVTIIKTVWEKIVAIVTNKK